MLIICPSSRSLMELICGCRKERNKIMDKPIWNESCQDLLSRIKIPSKNDQIRENSQSRIATKFVRQNPKFKQNGPEFLHVLVENSLISDVDDYNIYFVLPFSVHSRTQSLTVESSETYF